MSNEPVKLELECAPYSHHHHHHHPHHHLPHHNPHLQHHHNPHVGHHHHHHHDGVPIPPPHLHHDDEDEEEDEEEEQLIENDEDGQSETDETKNANQMNEEHKVLLACSHRGHINKTATTTTTTTTNPGDSTTHNDSQTKHLTQLENVIDHPPSSNTQTSLATATINALSSTLENVSTASSSSTSGTSSDSGESDDEETYEREDDDVDNDDDEQVDGDDDDEGEDEEEEEDEDDEDDEDEYDDDESEDDSFDIVDPVGHQIGNNHLQPVTMNGGDCDEMNSIGYGRISCNNANGESNSDEDVSFDSELGDTVHINDKSTTPDIVDSERMFEVTRKLVRSTELDPDRDLRKQVLLRTAIRKLPHFMEYNHYSESFDQSFQMHNSTLDSSNTPVNCLSPTQHYEHHHMSLNHHLESQPKSYYHSVQPNAIQMSTTSLRMLDLNDDADSDTTANSLEVKHNQYENSADVGQASLAQHDYTSHTYSHHYTSLEGQTNSMEERNNQRIISEFSHYHQESSTGMIVRHDTLDNLYHPLESSVELKSDEQSPLAFPIACDYSQVVGPDETVFEEAENRPSLSGDEYQDNTLDTSSSSQPIDVLNLDRDVTPADSQGNNFIHQYQQEYDCNQNQTITTVCHDRNDAQNEFLSLNKSNGVEVTSPGREIVAATLEETIEALNDENPNSSDNNSNSSQSSMTSDDSVNSSSQSNDSAGDLSGVSMLETSLNTTTDYHHSSHDSGVALFSPRPNKRSSSSIGLDDEMDIDHLTDLTSSNQFNSGSSVSNLNHCKKLRKREIID